MLRLQLSRAYFSCNITRVSYNERRASVHADDSAINPAKKPLHYQLNVPSGWTLQRQKQPQVPFLTETQWHRHAIQCCHCTVRPNSAKLQKPLFTSLFLELALFAKVTTYNKGEFIL